MAKILVDWSQCTYRCVVLPDRTSPLTEPVQLVSQCTYRCVVLPDVYHRNGICAPGSLSQCTYRCVVLPDSHGYVESC